MLRSALAAVPLAAVACAAAWPLPAQSAPIIKHTGDTPEARRNTDALSILEAQGYCADLQSKNVNGFDQFGSQGNDFVAQITQNGRSFTVSVNPETGRVTRVR